MKRRMTQSSVFHMKLHLVSIQARDEVAELQKQLASYERDKVSLAVS